MRSGRWLSAVAVAGILIIAASGGSPGAAAVSGGDISKFPADAQPLLKSVDPPLVAALWEVRRAGPGTIVWKDGGGAVAAAERKAYLDAWQTITGWQVQSVAPSAKPGDVQANSSTNKPQFDVFENGSGANAILEEQKGYLAKLDPALFNRIFARFPAGYRHTDHWLMYSFVGAPLIWSLKKWPMSGPHPTSTLDLFNTSQFPGKRCMYKQVQNGGTYEFPLLADGVPKSKLYPLDIPRALKKLDTIKSSIVWWTGGAQSVQYILDGECDMGVTWHGRPASLYLQNPNVPVGVAWKDAMLITAPFSIMANTPHMKAAQSALAFAFQTESQCTFLNTIGYGVPMNPSCLGAFAKQWAVTPEHQFVAVVQNDDYYSKNYQTALNALNDWLTK